MAAYNRVTRLFQDGKQMDAADLNAALADMRRDFTKALQALAAVSGGSSAAAQLIFPDGSAGTFPDGSPILFQ